MHRLFLLGLLGACGGGGPATPPPASSADAAAPATEGVEAVPALTIDERINNASRLLTNDHPDAAREALEDLSRLVVEAPGRVEVLYNTGLAHEQTGDLHNAKQFYLRAAQQNPGLGRAWLNVGGLSEAQGDHRAALQHYRAGVAGTLAAKQAAKLAGKELPEEAVRKNAVCNALVSQCLEAGVVRVLRSMGRHQEAINEAKAALKRNTSNLEIYNILGLVYLDQGKADLAAFILERALSTIKGAENNATLHSNLGMVHLARERTGDARKAFETALGLNKDHVPAKLFMAQLLLDDRDWSAAAGVLESARDLEPDNAGIYSNLGIAYRGLERFDESRKAYEKAIELDAGNLTPYLNLALLQGNYVGDFEGGISAIQTYRSRGGPDKARADKILLDLDTRRKERDQAAADQKAEEAAERDREAEQRKIEAHEALQKERAADEERRREAEAAEEAARIEAEEAAVTPPADGQPAPAEVRGTRAEGAECDTTSQCLSGLSCVDYTCVSDAPPAPPPPAVGTRQAGAPCSSDTECAVGLSCVSGTCQDSTAPSTGSDAGEGIW